MRRLLRYNAMQIDVFALLVEARQRIASTPGRDRADEDFWLADADLATAVLAAAARDDGTRHAATAAAAGTGK